MNIICDYALTQHEDVFPPAPPTFALTPVILDVVRSWLKPSGKITVRGSWEQLDALKGSAFKSGRLEYEWFEKCYDLEVVSLPTRSDFVSGTWQEYTELSSKYLQAMFEDITLLDPEHPENKTTLRFCRRQPLCVTP